MKEIWKDIEGYEGLYQVSNFGEVKSLERTKTNGKGIVKIEEKILTQNITNWGYYRVALYKNGTRKYHRVHRLVAKAFIDNPNNKEQVNHIDGNKLNNHVSNLEWCTRLENMYHARITGLIPNVNYSSSYILLKDDNDNVISQYSSFTSFSKNTNINAGKIIKTLKNNNVNFELIEELSDKYPLDLKLNKFSKCAKYFPIAIYDEEMNLLALYTNIANMVKFTSIPEGRGTNASKKGIEKYKKRGKQYKNIYYIKKISFVDFFTLKCEIIDDYLEIK